MMRTAAAAASAAAAVGTIDSRCAPAVGGCWTRAAARACIPGRGIAGVTDDEDVCAGRGIVASVRADPCCDPPPCILGRAGMVACADRMSPGLGITDCDAASPLASMPGFGISPVTCVTLSVPRSNPVPAPGRCRGVVHDNAALLGYSSTVVLRISHNFHPCDTERADQKTSKQRSPSVHGVALFSLSAH